MARLVGLMASASALLLTGAVVVQQKPDFSGEWVLERYAGVAADVADELIVRQWIERKASPATGQSISFDFIAIDRRVAGEVRSAQHQIGLVGGVVSGIDATGRGSRPQTRFSRHWEGATLVMEAANYSGHSRESGPYAKHREEWSRDAGKLLVVVTTRGSTSDPTLAELTYRRR